MPHKAILLQGLLHQRHAVTNEDRHARVSTQDQNLTCSLDVKKAGCRKIFRRKCRERPLFGRSSKHARPVAKG